MRLLQLYVLLCFFYAASFALFLELTDCNFIRKTSEHNYTLVLYYNSSCKECRRITRQFQRAASFIEHEREIAVGRVNCSGKGRETCAKNQIAEFPSLKLYCRSDFVKDYDSSTTSWHYYKFMRAQVNPASIELKSIGELRKFIDKQHDAILVGFFGEESTKIKRRFFRLAEEWKERMIFAHTYCENLKKREGVYDGIVMYRPSKYVSFLEEDRILYQGRPGMGEIKIFVSTHYHGLVGLRTPSNLLDFSNPLVIAYYNDYDVTFKTFFYWRSRIIKTAYKYKTILHFALSNKASFKEEIRSYGIHFSREMKLAVVANSLEGKKFVMTEEFSSDALDRFVDDFLTFRLKPYTKSKSIPAHNDGPILIAVADNFEPVVIDNNKDTLLQLYAPSCSANETCMPTFDQLGEILKDEDLAVVKMDGIENDVPDNFPMVECPTIYWVPKNDKSNPVLYSGEEQVDQLIKFVAEKATTELKGYDRHGQPKIVKTEL